MLVRGGIPRFGDRQQPCSTQGFHECGFAVPMNRKRFVGALQRLQRVDPTDVNPWSFRDGWGELNFIGWGLDKINFFHYIS